MDILYFLLLMLAMAIGTHVAAKPWPSNLQVLPFFPLVCWLTHRAAFGTPLSLSKKEPWYVVKIGGMKFSLMAACRGWEIDGSTGSGKTACAVIPLIHNFKKNRRNVGILSLDTKGDLSRPIQAVAKDLKCEADLRQLIVRPNDASPQWTPVYTMNLLGNPGIPYQTYAKMLVDVATAAGQRGGQSFFKNAAQMAIQNALALLSALDIPVNLRNCYETLCVAEVFNDRVERLSGFASSQYAELNQYFEGFKGQPPEQLSGVVTSIANYLHPYITPDIAEIFCANDPTFDLREIDNGRLISVKIPQKYQVERRYINLCLKYLYYLHAINRFDLPAEEFANKNMLVMVLDEAQEAVLVSEEGLSDFNVVDKIRGAKATTVNCTQSPTSYIPPMGTRSKAEVFLLNLANKIYFTAADKEGSDMIADAIGKHTIKKRSHSFTGGKTTTSITEIDEHYIKPHELRDLPKYVAIIKHCEKGFKRVKLRPSPFTKPLPSQPLPKL